MYPFQLEIVHVAYENTEDGRETVFELRSPPVAVVPLIVQSLLNGSLGPGSFHRHERRIEILQFETQRMFRIELIKPIEGEYVPVDGHRRPLLAHHPLESEQERGLERLVPLLLEIEARIEVDEIHLFRILGHLAYIIHILRLINQRSVHMEFGAVPAAELRAAADVIEDIHLRGTFALGFDLERVEVGQRIGDCRVRAGI